jgi:hypothetical protein
MQGTSRCAIYENQDLRGHPSTTEMQKLFLEWSGDTSNPHLEICEAFAALLRTAAQGASVSCSYMSVTALFNTFFYHAKQLDRAQDCETLEFAVLEELSSALQTHQRGIGDFSHFVATNDSVEIEAVRHGLKHYLAFKFKEKPISQWKDHASLLMEAIGSKYSSHKEKKDIQILRFLLAEGVDPNKSGDEGSAWMLHLQTLQGEMKLYQPSENRLQAIELMLEHGVDLSYQVPTSNGESLPIIEFLKLALSQEQFDVLSITLNETRKDVSHGLENSNNHSKRLAVRSAVRKLSPFRLVGESR